MAVRKSIHDYSRQAMIERLERGGIAEPCVLAAAASVPREWFAPPAHAIDVHADRELPIGFGEMLEPAYASIRAIDALLLDPDDHVLEIGTGTGYTAAVLSQLVPHVDSIERIPHLAGAARDRLARLGYDGIEVHLGDGSLGWPEHAPYDAIAVWAAAPSVPPALLEQLAPRGRLVMPIGPANEQQLVLLTKEASGACVARWLGPVMFTPLVS
jgi:protein-L-isoaspartate(D-aspartate) O-methyltransferase